MSVQLLCKTNKVRRAIQVSLDSSLLAEFPKTPGQLRESYPTVSLWSCWCSTSRFFRLIEVFQHEAHRCTTLRCLFSTAIRLHLLGLPTKRRLPLLLSQALKQVGRFVLLP